MKVHVGRGAWDWDLIGMKNYSSWLKIESRICGAGCVVRK